MTTTSTSQFTHSSVTKPGFIRIQASCHRCGGTGGWSGWPGYTCFRCGGNGMEPNGERVYAYPSSWTPEQINEHAEAREDRRIKNAERKVAREQAKYEAYLGTLTAEQVQALEEDLDQDLVTTFILDIRYKARRYMDLSDRQLDALVQAVTRQKSWKADRATEEARKLEAAEAALPVPTGRLVIEGEILTLKVVENDFGSTLKMLVQSADGWKVWGTVPSSLPAQELRGCIIRFTATIEASQDDPKFGFFKRPAKAEVIGETEEDGI
jgi:hypothetical protein